MWRGWRGNRLCTGEDDSIPLRQGIADRRAWPAETDLAIGLETGIRVAAGFPELYFQLSLRAAL